MKILIFSFTFLIALELFSENYSQQVTCDPNYPNDTCLKIKTPNGIKVKPGRSFGDGFALNLGSFNGCVVPDSYSDAVFIFTNPTNLNVGSGYKGINSCENPGNENIIMMWIYDSTQKFTNYNDWLQSIYQ